MTQRVVHGQIRADEDVLELLGLVVLDIIGDEESSRLFGDRGVIFDLGEFVGLRENLVALVVMAGRVQGESQVERVEETVASALALIV